MHYKKALPPEQWAQAETFLGLMRLVRSRAQDADGKVNFSLDALRVAFEKFDLEGYE